MSRLSPAEKWKRDATTKKQNRKKAVRFLICNRYWGVGNLFSNYYPGERFSNSYPGFAKSLILLDFAKSLILLDFAKSLILLDFL